MVKHIVCFKLKDNSIEKKQEAANRILSMKENVDIIKNLEVGIDFLGSERSYDLIIQVTLADRDALDLYQRNQYHCDYVKSYMHRVMSSSVSVDYEF
ncbi:MAG: Dabb family protein [Clostridiales bacterium]|nr:Dabb family protein [Clostridiales bacterium]